MVTAPKQDYLAHFSLMELNKLRENLASQYPLLVPENYIMKPYNMKDEFIPFEASSSSKGYLQDFHHLDEFNVNGSSSNPMFGVQTPYFNPYDTNYTYEGSNSTDHLNFYECKPLADQNGGHGQVLDNFQSGGYLNFPAHRSSNPLIDMMGPHHRSSTTFLPSNCQEIKPMNFVVPDEVSCIKSENGYMNNKSRSSGSTTVTRGTYKGRKKSNVVKGQWTIEEDRLLIQLVDQHGVRKWSHIAQMLPGRIGKQCRERWHNHLRPDIKKDTWSEEEDKVLIESHAEIGNKWAEIAKRLPGRTENSIKNHWNATKRRQYSKRKCRSKYPRGSLLQEYIKSLNLDSSPNTGRGQRKKNSNSAANNNATSSSTNKAVPPSQPEDMGFCGNDRLVPNYEFSEDPAADFCFDDNIFEEGCNIESLLDDIPCAPPVLADVGDDENINNGFDGKMLMPAAAAVSDVDDEKSFGMDMSQVDVGTVKMETEVKKELDLVEMISQVNEADA